MTHDTKDVDTLPSAEQIKREFVTAKGNGSHTSLLRLLRLGMTVAQVERHTEDEVRERYLQMKAKYIDQWDKVFIDNIESKNTLSNVSDSCHGSYIMYISIYHPLQSCQVLTLPLMYQKTWTCPHYEVNSIVLDSWNGDTHCRSCFS